MTSQGLWVLLQAAAAVAFLHTIVGVDHTLPFVVMGKARGWSLGRTLALTAACGLGHVLGSVLLGFVGIGMGVALDRLGAFEGARGSLAAWGLIAFGLVYAAWSFVRSRRGLKHSHAHAHSDGTVHAHEHGHSQEHAHAHGAHRATAWALFVLFILGPCEALIPMLMAPAYERSWWSVVAVTAVFGAVTVGTMVALVAAGSLGMRALPLGALERHANTLAGVAIAGSGLAIQIFGI